MSQIAGKKKAAQKPEPKIVDEQKEPCLRALQKKVRNINKRLTEIEDLKMRGDLNPQQQEKVNRKKEMEEKRAKYEELIELYKSIAQENQEAIRKGQLSELEDLAVLLASREYGADVGEKENASVDNLVKVLTAQPNSTLTLAGRVAQINEALVQVANDSKLKEKIKNYLSENKEKTINLEAMSNEPEPRSPRSEKERENELKEIEEELQEKQEEQRRELEAQEEKKQEKPTSEEQAPQKNAAEPVLAHAKSTPHAEETPSPGEQAPKDEKVQSDKKERNAEGRESRPSRGRRRQGGNDQDAKNRKPRKYEPKHQEPPKRESSASSSSSSTPEARQFKKEEIKELLEDGFIVVGKPKPKAHEKDQKESYNHQHGKKFHPRHQKKNY